jgi:hypothetical protein
MLQAMSKLEASQEKTHHRWRSTRLALRLSKQRIKETQRLIEGSRKLLEQPVYPYDPRTVPKPDK